MDFGFGIDPAPLAVRGLGILDFPAERYANGYAQSNNFGFGIFSPYQGRGMNQKKSKRRSLQDAARSLQLLQSTRTRFKRWRSLSKSCHAVGVRVSVSEREEKALRSAIGNLKSKIGTVNLTLQGRLETASTQAKPTYVGYKSSRELPSP